MTTRSFHVAVAFLLSSSMLASCGASNTEILSKARIVEVTLMRNLPTGLVSWISAQAEELAAGRSTDEAVRQAAQDHASSEDIEASTNVLTFFVMMEASRMVDRKTAAEQNRTSSIGLVKTNLAGLGTKIEDDLARNSGKEDSEPCTCSPYEQTLTALSTSLEQSRTWISISVREPADVGDLRSLQQDLGYLSNTLNELGELQSMRLQALADRRSKILSLISSLFGKIADTNEGIIRNLK